MSERNLAGKRAGWVRSLKVLSNQDLREMIITPVGVTSWGDRTRLMDFTEIPLRRKNLGDRSQNPANK